jgi:cytochrome c biogenesis protein CcmG/thiol:disulfide interchange protein DsbE
MMIKTRFVIPLLLFVLLLGLLGIGLKLNPREVPSPLIGKPAPQFELPRLDAAEAIGKAGTNGTTGAVKTFSSKDMLGKVWIVNVWASWCVACRDEHPLLVEFAKTGIVPILGLNYKDERADGLRWLGQFGNPYTLSVYDQDGRLGIDYGVYGVPETFVVDKRGIIRYKQIGVLTPEILQQKIIPLLKELESNA